MLDVLLGDVGLGAVRGDPHDACPGTVGVVQVMGSTDTGQQQGGDLRVGDHFGYRLDPFQVGVGTKAVVEAGALQAVTVGHFDGVDLGLVQCAGDVLHVLDRILMADRMAAVTQGDVGDIEFLAGIECHGRVLRPGSSTAPCARRSPAPQRS